MTGYGSEYFRTDHLGNTRLTFSDFNQDGLISWKLPANGPAAQESEITSENHYYPFGLSQRGPWYASGAPENKYRYNGKEWNDEWGLNMYDYGARGYMPDLGRWGGVDALAERYYAWSGYNYVMGNPIRLIDPDGMAPTRPRDDYYDRNGNFLFRDSKKTDFIKIVDDKALKSVYPQILNHEPGAERSQFLEEHLGQNSKIVSEANISAEAWSNITTGILKTMEDIDVSNLHNGKVSVLNYNTSGTEAKYNDPTNFGSVANVDPKMLSETGVIKITIYLWSGSADSELRTVSNVKNTLGAHEYLGHGVKRYSDRTSTHHKAYELQMNHPSWGRTTPDFKEFQKTKYNEYKSREKK